jgi:hypothetical protein
MSVRKDGSFMDLHRVTVLLAFVSWLRSCLHLYRCEPGVSVWRSFGLMLESGQSGSRTSRRVLSGNSSPFLLPLLPILFLFLPLLDVVGGLTAAAYECPFRFPFLF